MNVRLSQIREALAGVQSVDFSDVAVTSITHDSRKVREGALFVALEGGSADGHHFVAEAIRADCAAVIASRPLDIARRVPQLVVADTRVAFALASAALAGNPARRMTVVGVTGTNGKTTTSTLVRACLQAGGFPCALFGTVSYEIGERSIPAPMTTPDPPELHAYLAEALAQGIRHASMEVSSHSLHQHRVDGIPFAAAIFTNLTRDHLDYHKTPEAYRDAKGILFEGLSPQSAAILNSDDETADHYGRRTKARVVRYGLSGNPDVGAEILDRSLGGTRLALRLPTGTVELKTRLIGRHNVSNLLAAAACAHALGIPPDQTVAGLAGVASVRGRLEPVEAGQPFAVLVDYAHTDDALANVLRTLREVTRGRILTVFGCGGDRDRGKRPLMGRTVERLGDFAFVTSDNPRSEDPQAIVREILAGMTQPDRFRAIVDRTEAIREAIRAALPGDAILIAGKGHETYQIFRDGVKPFDDRLVARAALSPGA